MKTGFWFCGVFFLKQKWDPNIGFLISIPIKVHSLSHRLRIYDSRSPKTHFWALTELVASPSFFPLSAFSLLCGCIQTPSALRPGSHYPPRWSALLAQEEGEVNWFCPPSVCVVNTSEQSSQSTPSPRNGLCQSQRLVR